MEMIYDEKYLCIAKNKGENLTIFVGTPGPCAVCGRETQFIDVCWEAHICSEECDRILFEEFAQGLKDDYDLSDEHIEELVKHEAPSCKR